tara:strand:+ start:129749 stop:130558 length:810 start_codon:yes stop_codon:yes gene_type:complete
MTVNESAFHPKTPLMEAILLEDELESVRWVRELLAAGEDPNQLDYTGYRPPLYEAWGLGKTAVVRLLLDNGAQIITDKGLLDEVSVGFAPIEATLLLLEAGHSFKECVILKGDEPMCESDSNHLTYLLEQERWDHIQAFEKYDLFCLINAFGFLGLTPLAEMARDNRIEQARWLLDKRANVNAHCRNCVGYTALEEAVDGKHLEMIKLLIDAGANPNIRTWMRMNCVDRVQPIDPSRRKQRHNPEKRADLKEIKDLVLAASKNFPIETL